MRWKTTDEEKIRRKTKGEERKHRRKAKYEKEKDKDMGDKEIREQGQEGIERGGGARTKARNLKTRRKIRDEDEKKRRKRRQR